MRRLLATVLAALALPPLAAAAAKQPVFGLRAAGNPKLGYFVYPLAPGAVRNGAVIVSNSGTGPGTVKLFTTDATTGRTTGTVYLTDRRPSRTGAWIKLSSTSLFLRPGAHRLVRFTVRVPSGANPGEWVGGIVAESGSSVTGPKTKQKASVRIRIRNLTIVAVQANVSGPRRNAFSVGAATTGGQRSHQELITHLTNNGNVLVRPTGTATVLDSNGAVVETVSVKMDTFLPQTAIDFPWPLKKALAPGSYTANIRLSVPVVDGAAAARVVSASPSFAVSKQDVQQVFTSATPQQPPPGVVASSGSSNTKWIVVAAVAAAVLLALLLAWFLLRRRRHPPEEPAAAVPPAGAAPMPVPVTEAEAHAAPEAPAPEAPPEAAPRASGELGTNDCDHLWEVDYDRGQLGDDGVWRFPHRCRTCGLELLASDVADATAQAGVPA